MMKSILSVFFIGCLLVSIVSANMPNMFGGNDMFGPGGLGNGPNVDINTNTNETSETKCDKGVCVTISCSNGVCKTTPA